MILLRARLFFGPQSVLLSAVYVFRRTNLRNGAERPWDARENEGEGEGRRGPGATTTVSRQPPACRLPAACLPPACCLRTPDYVHHEPLGQETRGEKRRGAENREERRGGREKERREDRTCD